MGQQRVNEMNIFTMYAVLCVCSFGGMYVYLGKVYGCLCQELLFRIDIYIGFKLKYYPEVCETLHVTYIPILLVILLSNSVLSKVFKTAI